MRLIVTALLFVLGLLFLYLGAGFILDPSVTGSDFGLSARGAQGLSTIRGDMTAIFWVTGICMIWGAWKRNGDLLLVPAAIFGIALFGRIVSIFADGTYPGFWSPMLVEAVAVILSLVGSRVLPHRLT